MSDKLESEIKRLRNCNQELHETNCDLVKRRKEAEQRELKTLKQIAELESGHKGTCFACERVGELNQQYREALNQIANKEDVIHKEELRFIAREVLNKGAE